MWALFTSILRALGFVGIGYAANDAASTFGEITGAGKKNELPWWRWLTAVVLLIIGILFYLVVWKRKK